MPDLRRETPREWPLPLDADLPAPSSSTAPTTASSPRSRSSPASPARSSRPRSSSILGFANLFADGVSMGASNVPRRALDPRGSRPSLAAGSLEERPRDLLRLPRGGRGASSRLPAAVSRGLAVRLGLRSFRPHPVRIGAGRSLFSDRAPLMAGLEMARHRRGGGKRGLRRGAGGAGDHGRGGVVRPPGRLTPAQAAFSSRMARSAARTKNPERVRPCISA